MPTKSVSVQNQPQQDQSLTVPVPSAIYSSIRRQATMAAQVTTSKKASLLDKKQKNAISKRMSGQEKEESPKKVNPAGTSSNRDKFFQAPETLDLFALETRARRTIGELIRPIVNELDSDRRRVAEVISKQDRINARLGNLEYALGLNDQKPKVFEDIENTLAEIKADIAVNRNQAEYRVTVVDQKLETLNRDMVETVTSMKALESINAVRETETKRANDMMQQIKFDQAREIRDMTNTVGQCEFKLTNQLQAFDQQLKISQEQVKGFESRIKEMDQFIKLNYETSTGNKVAISRLSDMKVNSDEFMQTRDRLIAQIETIKFATYDNFRVVRATDNFIEKYLPFQIQDIVSKNMMSIIKRPFTAQQIIKGQNSKPTKEQMQMQEQYDNFKEIEYKSYKSFHRNILNDDGIPKIKKTSFRMPGYRQILQESDEVEYTVDNERIYNRMHERKKQNRAKGIKEEIDNQSLYHDSDNPLQDIMPIESVYEYQSSQQQDSQNQSNDKTSRDNNTPSSKKYAKGNAQAEPDTVPKRKKTLVNVNVELPERQQKRKETNQELKILDMEPDFEEQERNEGSIDHSPREFGNDKLNKEQDIIEVRQVRNIERMMNFGNQEHKQRQQASPFLEYAVDKYQIKNEDVQPHLATHDGKTSTENAESYVQHERDPSIHNIESTSSVEASGAQQNSYADANKSGQQQSSFADLSRQSRDTTRDNKAAAAAAAKLNNRASEPKRQKPRDSLVIAPRPVHHGLDRMGSTVTANSDVSKKLGNFLQHTKTGINELQMQRRFTQAADVTGQRNQKAMIKMDSMPLHKKRTTVVSEVGLGVLSEMSSPVGTMPQNQQKVDLMSNINNHVALTFHERRKQTHYLVGFEDLEPAVNDEINKANLIASQAIDQMAELQKELFEHKAHIAKMTNNTDMPLLKPIKALINEQITTMHCFQNEIESQVKKQSARNKEYELMVQTLQERVKLLVQQGGNQINSGTAPISKDNDLAMMDMQTQAITAAPLSLGDSPMQELQKKREQILKNRPAHLEKRKNSRKSEGKQSERPRELNADIKAQVDISLQSGELLVDCMKLQNILNYELQKLLRQITEAGGARTNQVLIKDNLNVDSREQLYDQNSSFQNQQPPNIEANILAKNETKGDAQKQNTACISPLGNIQQRQRGTATCLSQGVIRGPDGDGTTTDLGIHSNEILPGALSDGSLNQHIQAATTSNMSSSPMIAATAGTAGIKINRDINMWNSLPPHQQQINCTTVISMLDQIRMRYEEMFNDYKRQRFQQMSKTSDGIINDNSMKNFTGSRRYLEFFKSADGQTLSAGGLDEMMTTDVTSRGGVRSPKTTTTIGQHDAISVMENGQLAIPIQTLNFSSQQQNQHQQTAAQTINHHNSRGKHFTTTLSFRGNGGSQSSSNRRPSHKRNQTVQHTNRNQIHINPISLNHALHQQGIMPGVGHSGATTESMHRDMNQQMGHHYPPNQQIQLGGTISPTAAHHGRNTSGAKTQSVYKRINVQQQLITPAAAGAHQSVSGHVGMQKKGNSSVAIVKGITVTGLQGARVSSIPSLGTPTAKDGMISGRLQHQASHGGSSGVSASMRASMHVHRPVLSPQAQGLGFIHQSNLPGSVNNLNIANTQQSKLSVAVNENAAMKQKSAAEQH